MRSARELLETARSEDFVDEDDEPIELTLLPGLDSDEVEQLEEELGAPLPAEIDELVRYARGFEFGPVDTVAFDAGFSFGMENILPRVVPLCGDGFGNFWLVEVQRTGEWGPVYFASHDPPVLAVQAKDMATFIDEVFALGRPDRRSTLDEVHDPALSRILDEDPWGRAAESLHDAGDETLSRFATELAAGDRVYDLRDQVVGSGFAWGAHGPDTETKRCGDELIFAVLTPAKKPQRPGFFKRLLGG